MATNVYGTGLNSTAGANTIVHYYDRAGIKAANRKNVYGQFVSRKDMPNKMGKTFKISKFLHMYDRALADADFAAKGYMTARTADEVSAALTNASLAEGAGAVNKRSLSKITVETSFARYGEMIDYTDEVELFSEDYIQTKYREELGELANSRMEDLIQLDMLGTGTVMYAGAATSKGTIGTGIANDGSEDADYKVSYDLIRKAVKKLVRNRAKKNTSIVTGSTKISTQPVAKAYYAIIDADVKSDLEVLKRGNVDEAIKNCVAEVTETVKNVDSVYVKDMKCHVKDGKIAVTAANCPDLVCVHTGSISHTGEVIACLPHKLIITISDYSEDQLDAASW